MAEIDIKDGLASNRVEEEPYTLSIYQISGSLSELLAVKNYSNKYMCIETIFLFDISNAQQIQLPLDSRTCDIDREQHRPSDDAADKTDGGGNF